MADPLCPTCGQPALAGEESFPFCSLRCKQVDLYRWITGDVGLERVEEPVPPAPAAPPPGAPKPSLLVIEGDDEDEEPFRFEDDEPEE